MIEIDNFYNAGFGWICRGCERALSTGSPSSDGPARILTEGEAESRSPVMSNAALARWADPLRSVLMCPRCGITEPVEKN